MAVAVPSSNPSSYDSSGASPYFLSQPGSSYQGQHQQQQQQQAHPSANEESTFSQDWPSHDQFSYGFSERVQNGAGTSTSSPHGSSGYEVQWANGTMPPPSMTRDVIQFPPTNDHHFPVHPLRSSNSHFPASSSKQSHYQSEANGVPQRHVITPPLSDKSVAISPQMHGNLIPSNLQNVDPRSVPRRPIQRVNAESADPNAARRTNAKIEIEPGLTVMNADQLIAEAAAEGNEELVLSRKHQKRLLRNRNAALSSRERKKQHTKDLESLRDEMQTQNRKLQRDNLMLQERLRILESGDAHHGQASQRIFELQQENERLNQRHAAELADLQNRFSDMQLPLHPRSQDGATTYGTSESEGSETNAWDAEIFGLSNFITDGISSSHIAGGDLTAQQPNHKQSVSADTLLKLILIGANVASRDTSSVEASKSVKDTVSKIAGLTRIDQPSRVPSVAIDAKAFHLLQELSRPEAVRKYQALLNTTSNEAA